MDAIYTLPLADTNAALEMVGGKGTSLARLVNAGMPVPDGFHVTTTAYRCFVTENNLQPLIQDTLQADLNDPTALEAASQVIRRLFIDGRMPAAIAAEITKSYADLCAHNDHKLAGETRNGSLKQPAEPADVAVRSSATAEDLPEASFAGQQDTYLNIRGSEAVLRAVQQCWGSLWTARAIAYRQRQGIRPEAVALAVVVQKLVPAHAAGVMFTANPVDGKRDEIVITATWGLGEAIVSGMVTPDTLRVVKATGNVIYRETAEKRVMTVRTEAGTQEAPVPEALQKAPVLSDDQAAQLSSLGAAIEKQYGMPMDIEWVLAGEGARGFSIVQARPITALPEPPLEWPLPHPKVVLARGSFAEFVPEPVSPLFATLAVPIARLVTVNLMSRLSSSLKDSYVFAVINDYVYVGMIFNLKIAGAMPLASLRMGREIIGKARQRESAVREKFHTTVRKWQALEMSAPASAPLSSAPLSSAPLPAAALLAGVRELFTATAEYYNVAQSATIPLSMMSEGVFSAFYNKLVKRKGDPQAASFLFGEENLALSAEKALYDLAVWVKAQPGLADQVLNTPADGLVSALQAVPAPDDSFAEFATRFTAYLGQYGHAIYDLDFAKPVPAEAPAPLLETLKLYMRGEHNPYERQRLALERRTQAAEAASRRLGPLRRRWFRQLLHWAQDTAPLREDSIANLGLGHPQIRRLLSELGRRLAASGAIAAAEDVYWLEAEELDRMAGLLDKGEPLPDHCPQVERRKTKWQAMRRITPPNTIPAKSFMARFYPSQDQPGDTIKGFGASAGRVTARACVMLGPEDFHRLRPGDVIVAGITTPAWTPLFARAAAIVTDIGGPLSHSSIVAREYGIPAVLATGNGTRRIQDGQMITVDGSAGLVTIPK